MLLSITVLYCFFRMMCLAIIMYGFTICLMFTCILRLVKTENIHF